MTPLADGHCVCEQEVLKKCDCQSRHAVLFSSYMSGQGSTGNVIAAVCSFFIPGLGQLVQGRLVLAIVQFCLAGVLWVFLLGWVIHLWSIIDAAMFKPHD